MKTVKKKVKTLKSSRREVSGSMGRTSEPIFNRFDTVLALALATAQCLAQSPSPPSQVFWRLHCGWMYQQGWGGQAQDCGSWLCHLVREKNTSCSKTKEMTVDPRRSKSSCDPFHIKRDTLDIVEDYKDLGVYLDNKLDWSKSTEAVPEPAQLRRLIEHLLDDAEDLLWVCGCQCYYSMQLYAAGWGWHTPAETTNLSVRPVMFEKLMLHWA